MLQCMKKKLRGDSKDQLDKLALITKAIQTRDLKTYTDCLEELAADEANVEGYDEFA